MTTITQEPAPPFGATVRSFVFICAALYLFFTAFAMEVYFLLPIAGACLLAAAIPGRKLLKHR